jgi:hypothetical protein
MPGHYGPTTLSLASSVAIGYGNSTLKVTPLNSIRPRTADEFLGPTPPGEKPGGSKKKDRCANDFTGARPISKNGFQRQALWLSSVLGGRAWRRLRQCLGPRPQRQAVDGPQRHLPCAGDHRLRRWHLRRERKVDEAALESDEHASINASVCPNPDVASARTSANELICRETEFSAPTGWPASSS